jgi:hypothetical protein
MIEDVLGKHAVVYFGEVSKSLEELPVENSILLRSLGLVSLEPPQKICLSVIQLALAVARYDLVPEFKSCILQGDNLDFIMDVKDFLVSLSSLFLALHFFDINGQKTLSNCIQETLYLTKVDKLDEKMIIV